MSSCVAVEVVLPLERPLGAAKVCETFVLHCWEDEEDIDTNDHKAMQLVCLNQPMHSPFLGKDKHRYRENYWRLWQTAEWAVIKKSFVAICSSKYLFFPLCLVTS